MTYLTAFVAGFDGWFSHISSPTVELHCAICTSVAKCENNNQDWTSTIICNMQISIEPGNYMKLSKLHLKTPFMKNTSHMCWSMIERDSIDLGHEVVRLFFSGNGAEASRGKKKCTNKLQVIQDHPKSLAAEWGEHTNIHHAFWKACQGWWSDQTTKWIACNALQDRRPSDIQIKLNFCAVCSATPPYIWLTLFDSPSDRLK